MKIQIRRGVFETNSSSVHTLTICLEPVNIEKYAGMTFKLGIPWDKRQTNDKLQERLDSLFDYMTMNDSLTNFIYCKNRINKVISKYEIKFDYLIDENGEYESSGWCEDVLDNIFNNNVDDETFEKYLLGYIFNNKSSCQCFDNNYFSSDNDLPQGSKYKNFYEYC